MAGQPSAPEDHAATLLPTEPRRHDTVFMVGVQRPFRSWGLMMRRRARRSRNDQLLSSGLIFFSNSSIEASPLIFSPLMKKVGVESTFSTSLAYFWSAAILSSRD